MTYSSCLQSGQKRALPSMLMERFSKRIPPSSTIAFLICFLVVSQASLSTTYMHCEAEMKPYPGYTGTLSPKGTIFAYGSYGQDVAISGILHMRYNLESLEPYSTGGLHIHTGYSCKDASLVGGHYYKSAIDLWTTKYENSSSLGASIGSFTLNVETTITDNANRAVVLHSSDGTRVGCGILQCKPIAPPCLTTDDTHYVDRITLGIASCSLLGIIIVIWAMFIVLKSPPTTTTATIQSAETTSGIYPPRENNIQYLTTEDKVIELSAQSTAQSEGRYC